MYTKGGVDEVLERCINIEIGDGVNDNLEKYKAEIYKQNEEMAKEALRVLACGYKVIDKVPNHEEMQNIENGLTFIRNVWNDRPTKTRSKTSNRKMQKCRNKNSNDYWRP